MVRVVAPVLQMKKNNHSEKSHLGRDEAGPYEKMGLIIFIMLLGALISIPFELGGFIMMGVFLLCIYLHDHYIRQKKYFPSIFKRIHRG